MDGLNCAAPIITMREVSKWYGDFQVLDGLDLDAGPEKLILCGPSGSGKSTTIRLLNRLEEHQRGRIVTTARVGRGSWATSSGYAPRWAWCSSTSICSRT